MSKRYFRIDLGRYGGEITIGTVTSEFVEYWSERDEDELREHVLGCEWDDEDMVDADSPAMTDDGNSPYFEIDDILHMTAAYADNDYEVTEIKLKDGTRYEDGQLISDSNEWGYNRFDEDYDTAQRYNYGSGASREFYSSGLDIDFDEESDVEYTPVLMFHSAEKGGMGDVYIETDENGFDPNQLVVSSVETDLCELIERVFYNRKELAIDMDNADTNGKGMYCEVAYLRKDYIDGDVEDDVITEVFDGRDDFNEYDDNAKIDIEQTV